MSETSNTPSNAIACIFKMAKRVIAAAAELHAAPGISMSAKMKILHALLVAVTKAVGMRIKQECEKPEFGSWVTLMQKFLCISILTLFCAQLMALL